MTLYGNETYAKELRRYRDMDAQPFVPLLSADPNTIDKSCNVIDIDDIEEFPPLGKSSSPNKDTMDNPCQTFFNQSNTSQSFSSFSEGNDELNFTAQSFANITTLSDNVDQPFSNPTQNGLHGKFLPAESQFHLLAANNAFHQNIPKGVKENVFFLIHDEENKVRRQQGKGSQYPDDCGAWKSSSNVTKSDYFLKTQSGYQSIKRDKNGNFYRIVRRTNVILSPQPSDEHVVVLKRKYSVLARCNEYRKRVTWCEGALNSSLAIVEYIGTYVPNVSHGNAKNTSVPYRRLTKEQTNIIQQGIKDNKKPREIRESVRESLPDEGITLKTAKNALYTHNKTQNPEDRQNLADDVVSVLNMLYENDNIVQEVIASNTSKPPSVILFSKEQILSMKSSIDNGCIIGIDRTFNVGACYLTVMTFKNPNITRQNSVEHPIMIGPMYLHWDGSFQSYHRFLSLIQSKLCGVEQRKIIFDTDGEKALINAIEACFPESAHTLCTRHLKENLIHNLQSSHSRPEVSEIVNKIFNKTTGLLSIDDVIAYQEKEDDILEEFNIPYLQTHISKIREFVFRVRRRCPQIPKFWTNNNNESMNNIIKIETNWKILKMPKLIETLQVIEQRQTRNIRDCIHGRGDFALSEQAKCLQVSDETWQNIATETKEKRLLKLLNFKTTKSHIVSSDNTLKIPKVAKLQKNLGK
ncbi:hypothetical protein FSP39_009978 [Pinctada imbricata]|uniref:MULE transposase domain-containing protein n=1 Tax=Pinctada imbricata TaxID=66713 RepID=A0AA88Y038_PINIB|nr:hypothetical protein FSP39_009978 [Pinctada imbricata]